MTSRRDRKPSTRLRCFVASPSRLAGRILSQIVRVARRFLRIFRTIRVWCLRLVAWDRVGLVYWIKDRLGNGIRPIRKLAPATAQGLGIRG